VRRFAGLCLYIYQRGNKVAHAPRAYPRGKARGIGAKTAHFAKGNTKTWKGLWLTDWQAHLVNLALHEAKVIHYQAKLDPVRQKVYLDNKLAIANIVESIAQRISRELAGA
jgi:hypothetical protein